MFGADNSIENRLQSLERNLEAENPILLAAVKSFREMDKVAYRMGFLRRSESFATMIPWWPLISVLGTFSAGKSTFVNDYLQYKLQTSGNQAVDDKFTVICHSREQQVHVLPGLALDADPRFPFYQISEELDKVAAGEGKRIDSYLQLKTCPSERLRGKIIIDSPGFDADEQRTATLRITDHIIDLSDLVLVLFDARHPEPGAMQDTLNHLVAKSIHRSDATKFLYILNQIDTAAREDNPEEVFGAWQRALAQKGLTGGRFYTIYNEAAAMPIDDDARRARFQSKRDHDLAEIQARIHQVEIERAYRIVGGLEKQARKFEERYLPLLGEALRRWRKLVLVGDAVLFGAIIAAVVAYTLQAGYWQGLSFSAPWSDTLLANPFYAGGAAAVVLLLFGYLHFLVRGAAAKWVGRWLTKQAKDSIERRGLLGAFTRSTRKLRSLFIREPAGWGRNARRRLAKVIGDTDSFVQQLNDRYANPNGAHASEAPKAPDLAPAPAPVAETAPTVIEAHAEGAPKA